MKRKPTAPTHVDLVRQADRECPVLSWRERQGSRHLTLARRQAKSNPGSGFDPLQLRLGLQAQLRQNRPYYAISSPIYHDVLLRGGSKHDDSVPGPAWLATVYRGQWRDLVVLPGVAAVLQARAKAIADQYRTRQPAAVAPPQRGLFEEATC